MRRLAGGAVVLALLWSGYWALGTWALQQGVAQAVAQARTQGLQASLGAVDSTGYPLRFVLRMQDVDLGDPVTGQRWQVPGLALRIAAWRPWVADLSLTGDQRISLPGQDLLLQATALAGRLATAPDPDLPLSAIDIALAEARLQSSLGWQVALGDAQLVMSADPATPGAYDMRLDVAGLEPDPALIAATGLPAAISRVALRGAVTLTAPLDRHAGQTQPRLQALSVTEAQAIWGPVTLTIAGQVMAGEGGLADGRLEIGITGWRNLVPLMVAARAITPELAPTVEGLLNALAAEDGDAETLSLPLIFAAGRGTLGPLPLGPAPRLNQGF
jgi:hypothetical protein